VKLLKPYLFQTAVTNAKSWDQFLGVKQFRIPFDGQAFSARAGHYALSTNMEYSFVNRPTSTAGAGQALYGDLTGMAGQPAPAN